MKVERFVFAFAIVLVTGAFLGLAWVQSSNIEAADKVAKVPAKTEVDKAKEGKRLVFSDDFKTTLLDDKKWTTCYDWRRPTETGCTNQGNFEQQWYDDGQVTLAEGNLVLTAERRPVDVVIEGKPASFKYVSGMVNSGAGSSAGKVRWSGTYGYYEARIKFDKGQGIWPAFWLLPVDKQWPPEIDVMEFVGSKPGEILQTVHWQDDGRPAKSDFVTKGAKDYSTDWHTYAIDWQPDRLDWYIDGKKTRSFTGSNVPDKPMEIIINLAVGGTLPGDTDETTPAKATMLVDYVQVYQSNDQIRPQQ